ncbi:enoyl-CoA hydratase/isomerase family protein [Microvirga antarctica]|uniref:enoyl-CoA hydratase/isomerase family protein n=1 Tax=Microvirga antarctica TaxID=2819233 RepID=UPI001FE73B84|nr:enoyl-CoA hydratase/isomerase family protein [Microvirga antarctica]
METRMDQDPEILCEIRGEAGLITLNRPRALNALTLDMVRAMRVALDAWQTDPAVTRVVVRGAGEKAFCAGGDIRRLTDLGRAGRADEALAFWREEYQLNALIQRYPKPYIALIDGIVMGGGVGISLHGRYRVAGERYLFAMPEVGIGFFPDVGATYALPRLRGRAGLYIALTGERIRRADALMLDLATHAVASQDFDGLLAALAGGENIDQALAARSVEPGPPPLAPDLPLIDRCFGAESVGEILTCLDRDGSESARRIHAAMDGKSPTSLSLAFEQMRRGGALTFDEAMKTEFRIVSRILDGEDFYEGVRAVLIDKDGAPRWNPPDLAAIDAGEIARFFAALGPDELEIA